jgi:hypothetical protein
MIFFSGPRPDHRAVPVPEAVPQRHPDDLPLDPALSLHRRHHQQVLATQRHEGPHQGRVGNKNQPKKSHQKWFFLGGGGVFRFF